MAKNSANFSGSVKKNQEKISVYSKQLESSEKQLADYSSQIDAYKVKIKDKEEEILQLQEKKEKLTEKEKDDLKKLEQIKKDAEKILKDNEKAYARTINSIEKVKSKLEELEKVNQNIIDSTTEYDNTLRSIGSQYGEINSVYKESKKILEQSKNEIAGIISITGLLNSSNKDLVDGILKAQSGYRGITNEVVKNIGTLEDSESAYKKISYQIEDQKKLVSGLSAELDKIDTSDETQIKAAEKLKNQLLGQADALGKMKGAAQNVTTKLQGITKAGQVLSSTPIGGFIDDILAGTKQLMSAFGIDLPGSISDLLESSKKGVALGGLNKIKKESTKPTEKEVKDSITPTVNSVQQTITPIEPPEVKLPGQIETKVSTEALEKEQTIQSKKTSNGLDRLFRAGQKNTRKQSKKAELTPGQIKQDEPKIPQPDQTSIDNSKETNNVTNVTNVGDAATPTVESGTKPLQDVAESIASPVSQELKTEATDYSDKAKDSGTDAMGSIASAGESVIKGAELAGAAGGGGALAAAGPYVAAAAGLFMLGKAVADATRYFDSLEDATDTLARSMYNASQSGGTQENVAREAIGDFSNPIGQFGGEDVRDEVINTKEYRQLVFDFSIGQSVKQRQELAQDYFNFEKQNYMDLVGYQQSLTTDAIDYEIGLQRDAINFRFQQESANLDAELEKRKTLAGSAMKFIGNYAKVSERALNAIGSSTKAIMDGMKQFGAILGGTTKQQFSLIENAQGLSYSYGASADQVLNISHMFKLLGNTTENAGMRLVEGIKGFVGPTGNVQAVFNEIVEASADIYRLMSATPNEIAKQTVALQKAGVKLSSMLKASDTMVLNYKDSIKAEMSLGAMIGRNVSFNEARARLMSGDMVGAANAIRQSLGGIDVNQLNPFAKQELTRATGLQLDQIIQLQQTGKIETEGDKQLKQAKLTGKAIADGVLSQDIANAAAKLALEQKQRKEMLEFEQRVRLLNLGVEQAKRLQMIPIEAAYRAKYAQDIQFKQDVDNMVLGVIREGITGTFSKLNVEQYTQIGNEMMAAYGLPTNPAGVGTPTMLAGISQLQTTLSNLNTNIPSLVSVTDPKYAQYMSAQFRMGEEYRSEISKKGITDEEKNKIALKYKDKATELYNTSFSSEIQKVKQQEQETQNKKLININEDITKINKEFNASNTDEIDVVNVLKKYKTQEEFESFSQQYEQKTGKKLNEEIKNSIGPYDRKASMELQKHLNSFGYGFTFQDGMFKKEPSVTKDNTMESKQGPAGTSLPATTSDGTGFQQGPTGNGTYTPPGGQSIPTGPNAYTPPGGETISNEKDITNQTEVVKVLNKIQSEAHSRGITMHTEQKTTTAYIKSSAEKLHYAKVAVEGTKMDSTKLVEKGIPSTQNLEQISIEMIKELQVANELLAGVFNNTQPAEGGIVLNLDGKKLATNFQNRMNNRQAFNNANRTRTNP